MFSGFGQRLLTVHHPCTGIAAQFLNLRAAASAGDALTEVMLALAKRLVTDHGLGLAPGAAFGPEGEGWLRWCFAL